MSNQHKHPTISFRISDAERKQIEARILASGMMKKDYFVRSCCLLYTSLLNSCLSLFSATHPEVGTPSPEVTGSFCRVP